MSIVCVLAVLFETVFVVLMQKVVLGSTKVVLDSKVCKTGDQIIITTDSYKNSFFKLLSAACYNV